MTAAEMMARMARQGVGYRDRRSFWGMHNSPCLRKLGMYGPRDEQPPPWPNASYPPRGFFPAMRPDAHHWQTQQVVAVVIRKP